MNQQGTGQQTATSKQEKLQSKTLEETEQQVSSQTQCSNYPQIEDSVTEVKVQHNPPMNEFMDKEPISNSQEDTSQEWMYQEGGELEHQDDPTHMENNPVMEMVDSLKEMKMQLENDDLMRAHMVKTGGYPNRYGAKIPVQCKWNLEKFEELLQDYEDKEVTEWMKYGWPAGRLPTLPSPAKTFKNHKGATDYPEALKKYIQKEASKGAIIGPFNKIPFKGKVGISPISTRPKKGTTDRRIIIDLSFPPGEAVNDGMIRDNYLGKTVKLTFPRVDDLALRIHTLGKSARMFKIDLSRYFRQLPLDPGDYSLMGYIIDKKLYFDKMLPMGMRTAPYIAQRVTNAIKHIHQQLHYFLLNYVDDFLGAEHRDIIWQAYNHLTWLLQQLRVDTAPDKIVPPTTRIEFLGITLDSQEMTMEIPTDKIEEVAKELDTWLYKTVVTRRETESLLGKLQFIGKCVKPGRVFIARLINWMKDLSRQGKHRIPMEARKDIAWWARYITQFNGTSIIWMHNNPEVDKIIATDASKSGFGGISGSEYFRGRFPSTWQQKNIAELEITAVIVALHIWGPKLTGQYFWVHVDNEAVAIVINSGAARDPALQNALREIALLAARHQFIIKAKHISGISNRIPDWLSRWSEQEAKKKFNKFAQDNSLKRCKLPANHLNFHHNW